MGSYDADGNPGSVSGGGGFTQLTYDEAGRVTSSSGGTSASYLYDGDGRRVQRSAGGVVTRFVYDGDQVCLETNGANAPLTYRLAGVGSVRASDGRQTYEQENALGSALTVRDNAGAVTGRTEYDAYGQEAFATGTERGGDFRFAGSKGYQTDDASGMQLLGARYYVPALGRFLTQDPIGHEGGLNLYAYCENSPLSRVDPDGTDWDWAQYRHDVGQVFLGYGDALNPVNWAKGAWGAGASLYGNTTSRWNEGYGLMSANIAAVDTGLDLASGLWSTLTNWSTPRDFGNSVGTGLLLAAPVMKKIPSAAWSIGDGYIGASGHVTFFTVDFQGHNMFRLDYGRVTGKSVKNVAPRWQGKNILHYHRRGNGPGQGIGRHRPYETNSHPGTRW